MRDRIAAPLLVPRLQQPSAAAWRRCKGFPTGGAPTDGTRLEAGNMLKKTLVALSVATVSAGAVALPLAASRAAGPAVQIAAWNPRSEEQTSEHQSLMRISDADFCLKQKTPANQNDQPHKCRQVTKDNTTY